MGRRYQAILKNANIDMSGHDLGIVSKTRLEDATGFIIATPTSTHISEIEKLLPYEKPILCEKPLTRDLEVLDNFYQKHGGDLYHLTMVNQYAYLNPQETEGKTLYNYWNTGKDGLYWDCINIIGLARKSVRLYNNSPVWHCTLNGRKLSIEKMDYAYMAMVKDWVRQPLTNIDYAMNAHYKAVRYHEGMLEK